MQQQLKAGEFCPPDYPKVICKAGPRVVWVGLHKSGFTELCSVTKRPTETPLAAATRKLNQLKDKAGLSDAPADASGRPGACVEEQQPPATKEQQPPATEVLVCRPKREQQMLDFLQPAMISSSRQRLRREQGRRCKVSFQFCAFVLLSLFVKHAVDILVIHGVWCATFWSKKWQVKPRDGSNFPLRGLISDKEFLFIAKGGRAPKKSTDFAISLWQLFSVHILGA